MPPLKKPEDRRPNGTSSADPEYGSISTVGRHFGYSPDTVELLIKRGLLKAYRLAGTGNRRVKYADVEALLVPEEASA